MMKATTIGWTRLFALSTLLVLGSCSATKQGSVSDTSLIVEASCGQCNFELPGDSCDLAIRMDGNAYFVNGTGIDDHGDAHASDGLCNAVRQARVEGSVEGDRFIATSFALLPD